MSASVDPVFRRRQLRTALMLAGIAVGMVGLSYAAVPLYRLFCQITGFGGTPMITAEAPTVVLDRDMIVRLDAGTGRGFGRQGWDFQPIERDVHVKVGETVVAFYRATNVSDRPLVGMATFNVTPHKAGPYFSKIACFCFTEQRLEPGQSVDMPVSFFVDPAIANDRSMDDVVSIALSYTFFPVEEQAAEAAAPAPQPAMTRIN